MMGLNATKVNFVNKAVILFVFLTILFSSALAGGNAVFFKSEVVGQDLPFSDAVLVGETLYISGKGGFLPGTQKVPEAPREEVRLLMENFKTTLERVDMEMDDLVYVTVFCTDLELYSDFNEVYRSYFSKDYPARAFVGSGPLPFGIRFEMKGIAIKGD